MIYEISVASLLRNDIPTQPLTGEGWGEGERLINFAKLFIPLAFTLYHMVQGSSPPVTPRREGEKLLFTTPSKGNYEKDNLNFWSLFFYRCFTIFPNFLF